IENTTTASANPPRSQFMDSGVGCVTPTSDPRLRASVDSPDMTRQRALLRTAIIALAVIHRIAAQPAQLPRLAVLLLVDPLRADYVDRFAADWNGGLKRLVTRGAWFRRAAYPYLNTVTCPGHATVSTGTLPNTHGVIQNVWWDRDARRQVTCTDDRNATTV